MYDCTAPIARALAETLIFRERKGSLENLSENDFNRFSKPGLNHEKNEAPGIYRVFEE